MIFTYVNVFKDFLRVLYVLKNYLQSCLTMSFRKKKVFWKIKIARVFLLINL